MLGGMVQRLSVIRICTRFQQREPECRVAVEPGGPVKTPERTIGPPFMDVRSVGVSPGTEQCLGGCYEPSSTLRPSARKPRKADVQEWLPIAWTALGAYEFRC